MFFSSCERNGMFLCSFKECDEDCVWNNWSDWSDCTKSCGTGQQNRQRKFRPATGNGRDCSGDSFQNRWCNVHPCPVDCNWSNWGKWSNCSSDCDSGSRNRTRKPNSPHASNGGILF